MIQNPPIRILLIDDDEDEFIFIRDLLAEAKESQFNLEWTSDVEVAKIKMMQMSHDVYLLDFRLGSISGVDLLKEVVQNGCRAPIIVLTGYDDQDIDREAMNLGAADYLQKISLTSFLLERSLRYALYRCQMQTQSISQDRMASIGLIASSLAHEIGTPLGVIRGRAEYLSMLSRDNEAIKNNVEIITKQIDRVSGLIRSLLNLARGDRSEKIEAIPVGQALRDVLSLLGHEIKKLDISVENDVPETLLIHGQNEKLQQVLLNLIVNAIHAIKTSSESNPQNPRILKIKYKDMGARYCIDIIDSGCGISSTTLGNLFRPFYTTKNPGEGTGLGLATSLWIVESWGGTIEVESQEAIGTAFHIYLLKGRTSGRIRPSSNTSPEEEI